MRRWEKRLKDLSHILNTCGEVYFDPNLFRLNLNQFLQTARTVTFLIHKDKDLIPDFDIWHQKNILTPWANQEIMTWAKDSRNIIEKQGDLEMFSSIQVKLFYSYIESNDIILSSPDQELLSQNIHQLLKTAKSKIPESIFPSAAIEIKRKWVANSLEKFELIYVLSYIYGRLYEVCEALAEYLNISLDQSIPTPTDLDPISKEVEEVTYIKLSDFQNLRVKNLRLKAKPDFEFPENLVKLKEQIKKFPKAQSINDAVEQFSVSSETLFNEYGYHIPMLFLLNDSLDVIDFVSTNFLDRTDKYIFFRYVATRAFYLRAFAVIWISESWIKNIPKENYADLDNLAITGEMLQLIGIDATNCSASISWNIKRSSGNKVELKINQKLDSAKDKVEIHFLDPIIKSMQSCRN